MSRFSRRPRWLSLGHQNGTILAILNLHVIPMPPIKFGSILLRVWEMWFEEFQDGRHGYWNRKILAILNLHNTLMPPIKFQLQTRVWQMSFEEFLDTYLPWRPSLISERNNLSNPESPCSPNASHQLSA